LVIAKKSKPISHTKGDFFWKKHMTEQYRPREAETRRRVSAEEAAALEPMLDVVNGYYRQLDIDAENRAAIRARLEKGLSGTSAEREEAVNTILVVCELSVKGANQRRQAINNPTTRVSHSENQSLVGCVLLEQGNVSKL